MKRKKYFLKSNIDKIWSLDICCEKVNAILFDFFS